MEINELSYRFYRYWKDSNWQELINLIHKNIKFNVFWCDLELQGRDNFIKALKKGKNSFITQDVEIIKLTEFGDFSISEWRGSYTNDFGDLENFRKLLVFNWDEEKIVNFKVFETVVVDINYMSDWINSI